MTELAKKRPEYRNINIFNDVRTYRLPAAGWVSILHRASGMIMFLLLPFVLLWPFWLLTKFLGGRWVIVVQRNNHEVERELVRGWRRSGGRMAELMLQLSQGWRSGHYAI